MRDLTDFARDIIDGAIEHAGYGFIGEATEDTPGVWRIEDRYDTDDENEPGAPYMVTLADVIATMHRIHVAYALDWQAGQDVTTHRGPMKYRGEDLVKAMIDEDMETQLDVIDYLAIIEIAVFGEVKYA